MINRQKELDTLNRLLKNYPAVGIIGARQVGKTTLAQMLTKVAKNPVTHFDLENPEDLARLSDPMLALKDLRGLVIIDEIQRFQDLFQVLRVLIDRPNIKTRFLILGSASPGLLRQSSESLAGRIVFHELKGFSLQEVGINNHKQLWLRGGFPRSYLARSNDESAEWRRAFVRTFLERDIPQLGINIRSTTLRRFWTMIAHYHGQTWNASEFGRSFGVADTTVRSYLDILTSALVIRQLSPWYANISKRQVKAPKIFITDSGLVHTLLNISNMDDLEGHPKLGATWEGFVIDQVIRIIDARSEECFFWATHAGAELDLLVVRGKDRIGFEIKRTTTPAMTPSMRIALSDLKLNRLELIHAGEHTFQLSDNVRAVALTKMIKDLKNLKES
ncbi:MAG: ATP-binding protein [Calditrichia bacterium]|nr:ATP-binding protein [Calditrichia bacterium]